MIAIKEGADVRGLHPVMWEMLYHIKPFFDEKKIHLTITSGTDGKHSNGSKHYVGLAVDIRTRTMKNPDAMFKKIQRVLSAGFDIVLEGTHIHIEYDPKNRGEMIYV